MAGLSYQILSEGTILTSNYRNRNVW